MKKIFILLIGLVALISANEIQVFTTNTMDIPVDKKSKVETVYQGEYEEFMKNPATHFAAAAVTGAAIGVTGNNSLSTVSNLASAGAGALGGLAGYALGKGVIWFISDNQYLSIYKVTNSKGEVTLLQMLIVANNSLSDSELKEISENKMEKIKG